MLITARLMNGSAVVRELAVTVPDMNSLTPELVKSLAEDAYVIAAQAAVRSKFKAKERLSDQQIKDQMAKWVPGTRKSADPATRREKIKSVFANLSKDEKSELLKQLREMSK